MEVRVLSNKRSFCKNLFPPRLVRAKLKFGFSRKFLCPQGRAITSGEGDPFSKITRPRTRGFDFKISNESVGLRGEGNLAVTCYPSKKAPSGQQTCQHPTKRFVRNQGQSMDAACRCRPLRDDPGAEVGVVSKQ